MHARHAKMLASLCALVLPLVTIVNAYVPESTVATDTEAARSLFNLLDVLGSGKLRQHFGTQSVAQQCNASQVAVRREYSMLSNQEKLEYTSAVKCLMAAPSKIPPGVAPGAKSRYEDFVAVHVNQTRSIHFSGFFFPWHRYYIWSFEQALREECGYQGYLPYWNWGKSAKDPINSPYMDGSPYSQGGNGVWDPHNCTRPQPGPYCTPVIEGQGGGCVESGPYAGILTNISSTRPTMNATDLLAPGPFLSYQPRCIRRDISADLSQRFAGDEHLYKLLTDPMFQVDSIGPFQDFFEGGTWSIPAASDIQDIGLHGAGHYVFAGDPGGDVYNSPADPLFWLHHGMVDRTWWIWQNQKPLERAFMVNGTRTMLNNPPSDKATMEDIIDMAWVTPEDGKTYAMKNHVSSVAGPYCYIYG